jgi:tetratricopeptide (TPR) repeat protein
MQQSRIELINAMLVKEPNDDFLNYALALEYIKENNFNKAIEIFTRLILASPQYLASYYQLGKLHESAGEKETAVSIYTKGIEIARQQKNTKTLSELNEALTLLEE